MSTPYNSCGDVPQPYLIWWDVRDSNPLSRKAVDLQSTPTHHRWRHPNKSDPAGVRTQDPDIKSVVLYQLSYGVLYFISPQCQCSLLKLHIKYNKIFRKLLLLEELFC